MPKLPWMPFYPADYLLDTQPLSPAARGIWMDLICFLWRAEPRGTLSLSPVQWLKLLRCDPGTFATVTEELAMYNICDIETISNDCVTISSRRMTREEKQRKANRLRVRRHRSNKPRNAAVQDCNRENQNHISESEVRSQNQKSESEEEKSIVGQMPDPASAVTLIADWREAEDLIAFLNQRTGKQFQPRTPNGKPTKTLTLVRNLLKQQYTATQIRQVIANRWLKWGHDPKMAEFLRPSTLFRPSNFENYLGELGVGS